MAARFKLSAEQAQRVQAELARLSSKLEYQRALCAWLPAALGITKRQVAAVLGWREFAVANMQHRYRRLGEAAFRDNRFTPAPLAESEAQALRTWMEKARSPEELRRFLCVWLRMALGLPQARVASALGRSEAYVSLAQKFHRKGGVEALRLRHYPGALPEGSAGDIKAAIKRAQSAADLRRAICIFLRVVLELKPAEVAQAVGLAPQSVSRLCTAYLKQGAAVLRNPGRGGARRRLLTREQEDELLRGLRASREAGWPYGFLKFSVIQTAVERLAGRAVKPSSVHAILDRHGWSRVALVSTPVHTRVPKGI